LPRNKPKTFGLSSPYVEWLHDEVVSFVWPGVEPVGPGELRDPGLLSSAIARPFQTAFGQEIHDTIVKKAAALFHSLISNHPFQNGNKRTAVLALGHFLFANSLSPALRPTEMYGLAKATATYKVDGLTDDEIFRQIVESIAEMSVPFSVVRTKRNLRRIYEVSLRMRRNVRLHPLNLEQPPR
jgi:death-on-curing protein